MGFYLLRYGSYPQQNKCLWRVTAEDQSELEQEIGLEDNTDYAVCAADTSVVEWDKMLVDAMTVRMVNKPESMDTIVATNREYQALLIQSP